MTSFCAESNEKENYAEAPYFTNWKVLWKRRSLRIIRRFLKEELQSNQVKIPFMNWLFEKPDPFVASVTCSRYQIAFKWSVKFWLQLFSIRWDGKYFNGWNFYLGILKIQENWAGRNFITNSRVYSLLITQAKMQTEINNTERMAAFWPIGTAQIIRIVSYPIRKKSRFWLFYMWSDKEMYHALFPWET